MTSGVYPRTEETKQRLRKINLGRKRSKEYKQKMSECKKEYYKTHKHPMKGKKGRKLSKESIRKRTETRRARGNYNRSEEAKAKQKATRQKNYPNGFKHSEETKQKLSRAHTGKKHSEAHKQKNRDARLKYFETHDGPHKGKKFSEETRQKISKNNARYFLGKKHSEETLQKMRNVKLGKKYSEESKKKMRVSNKKTWQNKEYRERMFSTNSFFDRCKIKPTSIELLVLAELLHKGIYNIIPEFKIMNGDGSYYIADFFVFPNLIIEADGDYWHNREGEKEADQTRDDYLTSQNYKVLRFTETHIHTNLKQIGDTIEQHIGEKTI